MVETDSETVSIRRGEIAAIRDHAGTLTHVLIDVYLDQQRPEPLRLHAFAGIE